MIPPNTYMHHTLTKKTMATSLTTMAGGGGGAMNEALLCLAVGLMGGLMFALLHVSTELAWFHLLNALERRGFAHRLGPTTHSLFLSPALRDFVTTFLAFTPIAAVMCVCRNTFYSNARFSLDIAGGLLFTWCVMVLHDVHFWVVHTLMHYIKPVYMKLHKIHHDSFGDITVFNTAYSEALDVGMCISVFYIMVLLWLNTYGEWNPLYLGFVVFAINNVHMMGHCGYSLPPWIYGPASLFALLAPGAQLPVHHYLHHVDPRYNRALYFTWCDRLAGTYLETHPKLYVP